MNHIHLAWQPIHMVHRFCIPITRFYAHLLSWIKFLSKYRGKKALKFQFQHQHLTKNSGFLMMIFRVNEHDSGQPFERFERIWPLAPMNPGIKEYGIKTSPFRQKLLIFTSSFMSNRFIWKRSRIYDFFFSQPTLLCYVTILLFIAYLKNVSTVFLLLLMSFREFYCYFSCHMIECTIENATASRKL